MVIQLLLKEGKYLTLITLNTDFKVLVGVLAQRFLPFTLTIFLLYQTSFTKSKSTHNVVLKFAFMIESSITFNPLFLNFQKAYD